MKLKFILGIILCCSFFSMQSQTYVFGSLIGNPINATGWNVSGNAYVNGSQINITNPYENQSGSIFYQTPINIGACNKWRVDFDFRIFDGSAADGLAFCFLTNYPTGFVNGGGVGIPGSTNGLKIVFDTYNNGCGAKPEIQIFNGAGYDECSSNVISRQGNLPFLRSNNFQPASIIYDNGNITVEVNGTTYLTAFVTINYSGYMGFTASTGGLNDTHSIKNVMIYTNQAASSAGNDAVTCVDVPIQIGSTPNPLYTYSWSPIFGLSDPNIANPTFTRSFAGDYTYTVSTSFASTPNLCPSIDLITVTIPTLQAFSLGADVAICASSSKVLTATTSATGNPILSYSWSNDQDATILTGNSITVSPTQSTNYFVTATHLSGCTSTDEIFVEIIPIVNPEFTQIEPICEGETLNAITTVSDNGITGTWLPSLNNMTTTNYIFTPDANQCATNGSMTITINQKITPVFTQVAPICAGDTLDDLNTVSENGIDGSWSPPMNNNDTTNYIFTPDTGVCATATNMSITVNPIVTPVFTQVNAVCYGATINSLPLVSNNTISGSWSPDLDNTTTTNYIFAPDSGQCAIDSEMLITVIPNELPNFTQVEPICEGTILNPLPTISENGFSGTWSPQLDNTTTNEYTFTPNTGECADTATMTITVYPNGSEPTFDVITSYCYGESIPNLPNESLEGVFGSWTPSSVNNLATTNYTFTPTAGLCFNPATIEIVINQKITPVFTQIPPICYGTTFVANIPNLSNNGYYGTWSPALNVLQTTTYTFTPWDNECASETQMTIQVVDKVVPQFDSVAPICIGGSINNLSTTSNDGFIGTWSPPINNLLTTTYTFNPLYNQCAYERTLTIGVTDLIQPVFSEVQPVCSGAALSDLPTVSNNGIAGSWFPNINSVQSTAYLFTPTTGQCASNTTLDVEILPNSILPEFDLIAPICNGTPLPNLITTSNNGILGSWSPALNNLQTTTYTFTPQTAQCAQTTQLSIEILPKKVPVFTQVTPICQGQNFMPLPLISNNGISGTWSPTLNNLVSNNYIFTPNNGECAVTSQMNLTVHLNPEVLLSDGTICKSIDSGTITKGFVMDTDLNPYQNTIHWYYNTVFINGVYTSTYNTNIAGDYYVEVTDNATGCSAISNTVSVIEKEYSALFTTETTDFFNSNPSILILSSNVEGSIWYQLDAGPYQLSNQFLDVSNGQHIITIMDDEGCLFETIGARIFNYPKFFTPNGDGINEFWNVLDARLIPNFSAVIFDRSGKFIYNLWPYSQGWDGTYLGNKLPSDDYWFIIYYTENGLEKTHRSHFTLKR